MKVNVYVKKDHVLLDEVDGDYNISSIDNIKRIIVFDGCLHLYEDDDNLKAVFKEWGHMKKDEEKN